MAAAAGRLLQPGLTVGRRALAVGHLGHAAVAPGAGAGEPGLRHAGRAGTWSERPGGRRSTEYRGRRLPGTFILSAWNPWMACESGSTPATPGLPSALSLWHSAARVTDVVLQVRHQVRARGRVVRLQDVPGRVARAVAEVAAHLVRDRDDHLGLHRQHLARRASRTVTRATCRGSNSKRSLYGVMGIAGDLPVGRARDSLEPAAELVAGDAHVGLEPRLAVAPGVLPEVGLAGRVGVAEHRDTSRRMPRGDRSSPPRRPCGTPAPSGCSPAAGS